MSERRQQAFERREQDILQAALILLDDEQWERVTVAQIAEQAGIGKGTMYKHFASKEELYARLIMDDSRQLLAQLQQRITAFDDPVEWARDLFSFTFRWCAERPVLMRMHAHIKLRSSRERLSEPTRLQLEATDQGFFDLLAGPIETGMQQGVFVQRPLPMLFIGLHATFDGTLLMIRNQDYSACGLDGAENEQTFINLMVEFMLSILTGRASA